MEMGVAEYRNRGIWAGELFLREKLTKKKPADLIDGPDALAARVEAKLWFRRR